jgi:MoaA/NifB/PqqE/SkfB family radical SAM enzyme
MARFPFRLSLSLHRSLFTQKLRSSKSSPILRLEVVAAERAESSGVRSSDEHTPEAQILDVVRASSSPVAWIGGPEPLLHPRIGHLTRKIVDTGRYVFVETDGGHLRRCIFSFRPVSRLFLNVRLEGHEALHDYRCGRPGLFRSAIEGIRAAKLSGFLVSAQTTIDASTDLEELRQLNDYLAALDVDGRILLPATAAQDAAAAKSRLDEAWSVTPDAGWRAFSRLLQPAPPVQQQNRHTVSGSQPIQPLESPSGAYEESLRVP